MRKYMILAVAAIAAVAMTSVARADDIQTITAKLTPGKLDKKKYKPAQIYVEILTGNNTGDATFPEQPPSAYNTKVNFPANMKFDTKKAPKCKVGDDQLNGTTTKAAIDACGKKSIVSKSGPAPTSAEHTTGTSAWVTIQLVPGPGGTTFGVPVVVTAFNGKKKNTLYLHSRADSVNNTSILVGKIKNGPKGYGKQLNVAIPDLDAGAIARFTTTVKKGKYVQARCKKKTQKFQAISKYYNHADTTADFTSKCKQKKSKKHKK
jgi:hypothetical protein